MPTPAAPVRRWIDAVCVGLLLTLSFVLFLRHAPYLAHSRDGFTFTYLVDQGFLGYFGWVPTKISGRPFAGVSFRLVHDLLGGSVVAGCVFQALCLTTTAIVTYVLVRLLAPGRPGLAWIIGVLRLTWSFDRHLVTNVMLSVVFAEMLFALAALALVLGTGPRRRGRVVLAAAMGVCVLIATGTYQTIWPVIVLTPLLVASRVRDTGRAAAWATLGAWYGVFAIGATLSVINLMQWPNRWLEMAPGRILADWMIGVRAVLIDTLWAPVLEIRSTCTATDLVTAAIVTIVFAGVVLGLQRRVARDDARRGRRLAAVAGLGLAMLVASLLPPSIKDAAEYGNRFGYVAAWGWLVLVGAGMAWATGSGRRPIRLAAGLFAAYLVFISAAVWGPRLTYFTDVGAWSRVHYTRVMEHLAGVQEGTIVFVRGGQFEPDNAATTHLRMLSDTWETFWLHDAEVTPVRERFLLVHSRLVLKTTREDLQDLDNAAWAKVARRPIPFSGTNIRRSRIEVAQRVTLRWHRVFNQFAVDETTSNRARLHPGAISAYGETIYPDASRWFGGVFVDPGDHAVLARTGDAPTRAFRRYDWYPAEAAVAAVRSSAIDAADTVAVDADAARIHVSVPAGGTTVVTLRYRGDAERLLVRHVEGDTAWPLPCGDDARTWRSPPLPPGFHTLHLRTAAGTAAVIETVTLGPADG